MNLREVQKKFGTQAKCLKYMEKLRWGKTVHCAYCDSKRTIRSKSEAGRHHCYNCKRSFSVMVGTIFEDTRLDLNTWFMTITLMLNAKSGIAAKELQRQLGVTLKTAWFTAMKVRCAMISKKTELHGVLEMDESYFGSGKSKKLSKLTSPSTPVLSTVTQKRGRGTQKIPVVGIVERGGKVTTKVIEKLTTRNLMAMLKHYVKTDESVLVTDGFRSYNAMEEAIEHITVKHSARTSKLNTNTIEGYWGLIKDGIRGNFRSLSKKYLPFYLVEYDYKYNHRNSGATQFEDFLKTALTDESCLLNYKPKGDVKEIVYG